jgi:hypothetical protein
MIYVIGAVPKLGRRTAMRFNDSDVDWFVSYYTESRDPRHSPFGPSFAIKAWTHTDPIDQYSRPYIRHAIAFNPA